MIILPINLTIWEARGRLLLNSPPLGNKFPELADRQRCAQNSGRCLDRDYCLRRSTSDGNGLVFHPYRFSLGRQWAVVVLVRALSLSLHNVRLPTQSLLTRFGRRRIRCSAELIYNLRATGSQLICADRVIACQLRQINHTYNTVQRILHGNRRQSSSQVRYITVNEHAVVIAHHSVIRIVQNESAPFILCLLHIAKCSTVASSKVTSIVLNLKDHSDRYVYRTF